MSTAQDGPSSSRKLKSKFRTNKYFISFQSIKFRNTIITIYNSDYESFRITQKL